MFSLKNIKEYKRVYLERRKKTLAISGISIWFDWICIIIFSFVLFIILFIYAFSFFQDVRYRVENVELDQQIVVKKINTEDVDEVLEKLAESKSLKVISNTETATSSEQVGNNTIDE